MPHQSNDCTICDLITNTSNIKMNDKLVVSKSIHSESCRTIDSTSIGSSHSLSTSYSDLTSTASSSCTCSTTGSPTTSPTASPNPARPISFGSSPRTIPPTNSLSARCEPNPMPFRFNGYCNPAFVCSTDISEDRDSAKLVERSLTDRHLRVPMDSGYQCWIIAFSCCFINAILFGIYRSYALIYPELINLYQVSRGDATWPFSLCMTMVHMAGPLSSGLKRWFSTRCIYLIGCTMSCAALVACRFAPDIPSLILQIGLIQG